MTIPDEQYAIIQSRNTANETGLPLTISTSRPTPKELPSIHHVLVRILAVGLNPTDWKMVTHFYMEGNSVCCDFCGIVESSGSAAQFEPGSRVCGAEFPYRPDNPLNGAASQYMVVDSRHLLRVPQGWSDSQAAALGAIGWGTAALAISDPDALNLPGLPSKPSETPTPILVYGGATATGILIVQMLKWSGYAPIAVCSAKSAALVLKLGAVGTCSYTSKDCAKEIQALAKGPLKYAIDCITDAESVATCYTALSRAGGRYACLEDCPEAWRTRRAVKVKVVMGFEGEGYDVDLGHPVYSRKGNPTLHAIASTWRDELQPLLDKGLVATQQILELKGGLESVIDGLEMLRTGDNAGRKLVAPIAS